MADRRQDILDAALAVFLEDSAAGASVEAVRRRSGASVGSLYHWFPGGLVSIAAALFAELITGYQERFVATLAAEPDPAAGVRAVVAAHLAWVEEHPDAARYLLAAPHDPADPELRAVNAAFFARVRAWIAPHVADGSLRPAPIPLLEALWLGPSQELSRHWLAGRSPTPPSADAALLGDAAWAALRGDRAS